MAEQNNVLVFWQLTAFISSSVSEHCWHHWALKKNAHRRGLYYEIIIYMLNIIYQICFPTCWNWCRTPCFHPFISVGLRACTLLGKAGATHREQPRGKMCPWQYLTQQSDLDGVLQHLTAQLSCALFKNGWRGWSEYRGSFSMFMSAVLIPLLWDLGQSVSLLNTSNQNMKQ